MVKSNLNPAQISPQSSTSNENPLLKFDHAVLHTLDYLKEQKACGAKVAGIFCEYTPREMFHAANIIPISLCDGTGRYQGYGGSQIPYDSCAAISLIHQQENQGTHPYLELADLIVAENLCENKQELFQAAIPHLPMFLLDLTSKPNQENAFIQWKQEIERLKNKLEDLSGITLSDELLTEFIINLNEERTLRRKIAYLAAQHPPKIGGCELFNLQSIVSLNPQVLEAYRETLQWVETRPSPFAGCPRILLTGTPNTNTFFQITQVVEDAGAVVIAQENCTGLKPIMSNVSTLGDPIENLARKYFEMPCSCHSSDQGRISYLTQLIEDFQPQGIIDIVRPSCPAKNFERDTIKEVSKYRWNLPYMQLLSNKITHAHATITDSVHEFLEQCRPECM